MNKITLWFVIAVIIVGIIALLLARGSPQVNNETQTKTPTATEEQPESTKRQTVTVNGFEPQTITVLKGTKVVWENKSGNTISINSADHPTHTVYPPLNLGRVNNTDSASLIFDTPGTYGYHNHLDASQTGLIIVQE